MKIIAFIIDPASVHRYMEKEGLPTEIPEIAPPPQLAMDYEDYDY